MREDFRRKVTLALKKAAEILRVGDEIARKGCSEQQDSKGKAWWVTVSTCLQDGFGGSVAGQGGMSGGDEGGDAEKYSQASLQRAALAVGVLACSMVNIRLLLRKQ